MNYRIVALLAMLLGISTVSGTFSPAFRDFLTATYGKNASDQLSRLDYENDGSFGGGVSPKIRHRPVIFVHGVTMNAGKMLKLATNFILNGYNENEVYGTTYGPTSMLDDSGAVHCEYVKQIRFLIEAVISYTNSDTVNVISYSMGVITSRKAILGGKCVDTGEDIGLPLTTSVHTFIGIAGPNHGAVTCYIGDALHIGVCNQINGMICESQFIADINAKEHYEGKNVFVVQTIPDAIVGNLVCDTKPTARIAGANSTYTKFGITHMMLYIFTMPDQYNLITKYD